MIVQRGEKKGEMTILGGGENAYLASQIIAMIAASLLKKPEALDKTKIP